MAKDDSSGPRRPRRLSRSTGSGMAKGKGIAGCIEGFSEADHRRAAVREGGGIEMTSQNRNRDNRDRGIPPSALAFLRQLEALSDVRAGLPITSHRPRPTGLALIFAKNLFRRASQVFINELMRKQQQFNDIAIEL